MGFSLVNVCQMFLVLEIGKSTKEKFLQILRKKIAEKYGLEDAKPKRKTSDAAALPDLDVIDAEVNEKPMQEQRRMKDLA